MNLLGLDIQETKISAVVMQKRRSVYCVLFAEVITLPQKINIYADGQIKYWESVHSKLSEFVDRAHLKGMRAAVCLPAHLAMIQRIKVPTGLSDDDIFAEIKTHLKITLRGMLEPLAIDFTHLNTEKENMNIKFTAIREAHLTPYCECINASGLLLKIADIDIYAIKRMIEFTTHLQDSISDVNAALYIANELVTFIIYNDVEIINYDSWLCNHAEEFKIQFIKRVNQAAFQEFKINHIFLCCPKAYADMILLDAEQSSTMHKIVYLDWIRKLNFKSLSNQQFFAANALDLFLACGVAMRDVPKW